MLYKQIYKGPLGSISLIADDKGLIGAWFEGTEVLWKRSDGRGICHFLSCLRASMWLVNSYFSGENPDFSPLPLDLRGTAFQLRVWKILQEIPAGQTTTYGQIAKDVVNQVRRLVARLVVIPYPLLFHAIEYWVGMENWQVMLAVWTRKSGSCNMKFQDLRLRNDFILWIPKMFYLSCN